MVIGKETTPTPLGAFYLSEKIQQKNAGGVYGPWILSTNGYSEALDLFDNGLPVVAFHGTNQPDLIGTQASNGCIRMPNDVVTQLADMLPAGTPIQIVAESLDGRGRRLHRHLTRHRRLTTGIRRTTGSVSGGGVAEGEHVGRVHAHQGGDLDGGHAQDVVGHGVDERPALLVVVRAGHGGEALLADRGELGRGLAQEAPQGEGQGEVVDHRRPPEQRGPRRAMADAAGDGVVGATHPG